MPAATQRGGTSSKVRRSSARAKRGSASKPVGGVKPEVMSRDLFELARQYEALPGSSTGDLSTDVEFPALGLVGTLGAGPLFAL